MDTGAIDALLDGLARDPVRAVSTEADRAMLTYALKLNDAPQTITAGDVEALRAAGYDDRGIHDIAAITAYFAFVNRIADGLGVELEG